MIIKLTDMDPFRPFIIILETVLGSIRLGSRNHPGPLAGAYRYILLRNYGIVKCRLYLVTQFCKITLKFLVFSLVNFYNN